MKHLFLLVPNNSGSTLAQSLVARSPNVATLPREGQHLEGWKGPVPGKLGVVHYFSQHPAFTDAMAYDWPANRALFERLWAASNPDAPVRMEKSPPNVVRAHMLDAHFEDAFFVISWRNPYAMAEGILRNSKHATPRQAGKHALTMLEWAKINRERYGDRAVARSYEQLTADPQAYVDAVSAMLPELGRIEVDATKSIAIKGTEYPDISDNNAQQIANLSPAVIGALNQVFAGRASLLEHFGYRRVSPDEGKATGDRTGTLDRKRAPRQGVRRPRRKPLGMHKGNFNFKPIGQVDPAPFVAAMEALQPEWGKSAVRAELFKTHAKTSMIPVLWNEPIDLNYLKREDEIPLHHGHLMGPLVDLLRPIPEAAYGKGWFLRMFMARLPAGAEIPKHADSGGSFFFTHRVHVPIVTDLQVRFSVGEEVRHLPPGQCVEINNFRKHSVYNGSERDRVHLIFDWFSAEEHAGAAGSPRPAPG